MTSRRAPADGLPTPDSCTDDVAELTILIPAEQLAGLARLARQHGLTVGRFLRRQVAALLSDRDRHGLAVTDGR